MSDFSEQFEKKYKRNCLKDQFSDRTRAVRRNLLLLITVAISLSIPGIEFASFLWLDLSSPESVSTARGMITSLVSLELIVFISYGTADSLNWHIKKYTSVYETDVENTGILFNYMARAHKRLTLDPPDETIQLTETERKEEKKHYDQFKDKVKKILKNDDEARKYLGKNITIFNATLWFRIWIIDWFIPLGGGCIVLILNYRCMTNTLSNIYHVL